LTTDFADAVYRSFNDYKLAAKAYKECKQPEVLDIFKTLSSPKENFILIKGENPGIYNRQYVLFPLYITDTQEYF
ncbi:uncharacterized protein C8R40DRAFT_1063187, partial [Lentinula edodes]|uniref:uncharacterized protein n=1 Tax=Lentinula edodes TaxID=5353 RepID=UPI001E8EE5C6